MRSIMAANAMSLKSWMNIFIHTRSTNSFCSVHFGLRGFRIIFGSFSKQFNSIFASICMGSMGSGCFGLFTLFQSALDCSYLFLHRRRGHDGGFDVGGDSGGGSYGDIDGGCGAWR